MQETGILFNTEMVQANLEYRKGETRRNIKAGFDLSNAVFETCYYYGRNDLGLQAFFNVDGNKGLLGTKSRYGAIGDILWVKETYIKGSSGLDNPDLKYWTYRNGDQLFSDGRYVASQVIPTTKSLKGVRWVSPMYMPKVAARIWLRITDIQVQRLQDITEMEAINEGIRFYNDEHVSNAYRYKDYLSDASGYGDPKVDYPTVSSAVESYKTLWCSINGLESWDENPYVWVIKYDIISTTGKPLDFNAKTIPIDDRIPGFGGYMELMKK
jgi:hypothetical protein